MSRLINTFAIIVFLSGLIVFVVGWSPWIREGHRACMSGNRKYQIRHGWRTRCESNVNQTQGVNSKIPVYIVSVVTNAKSKTRGRMWFGAALPNGHPSSIHYNTNLNRDAMSVSFPLNGSIFMEATDFGVEYYFQIRTPDQHSASCYRLVNNATPNITFVRDAKC